MDLKIGSNAFRNTNGVLVIQGKEQVVLELRAENRQLLLTMDLYDQESKHVAHLRRNAWGFNADNRFSISVQPESPALFTPPPSLHITESGTGETVFEARVIENDIVSIPNARFYSHHGQLVEISSHYCRVGGGSAMFGDVADVRGGPVTIGDATKEPT